MIRRGVSLILHIIAGYVLGDLLAWLILIPIALVKHLSDHWAGGVAGIGGLLGVVVDILKWRTGATPADHWGVHGSAHWANTVEVRSMVCPDGLIVGRENRKDGEFLRYAGQQHLITIAPTRSGKGVRAIIPNLLTADRSILCIDPKGENARVAVHARELFGPVHGLDPFDVSAVSTAAFNPLDGLDEDSPDLAEDVAILADALIHDPPGQVGDAPWNEEAKALIAGIILYVVCHEQAERRNLGTVHELVT